MGMNNVKYVIAKSIINFVLVAKETTTATNAGIARLMPNSHKSNLESLVRMSFAIMNEELVAAPARPPSSTILIIFHQFISS